MQLVSWQCHFSVVTREELLLLDLMDRAIDPPGESRTKMTGELVGPFFKSVKKAVLVSS